MMTADEKNHVISNANEELDRQIFRLDTVFPYIAGEISDEARLGSLTHWAYSNKSAAKTTTNERPRREAVAQRQDLSHVLHEAEAASRSEARREAVRARARRPNPDADYEEGRAPRKTNSGRSRGDNATGENAAPKRRKVERPATVDTGAPMERSVSGTGGQRGANKDGAEKKRSRAPNPNAAAARKKYVISISRCPHMQLTISSPGPPSLRTLDRPFWHPPLLSAPLTIPHVELRAQARTHHALNLLEPNRMPDRLVIPDNDPLLRHPTALVKQTRVCSFALNSFVFSSDQTLFQPNQWNPDLLRASPSKPKLRSQKPAKLTANPAVDPLQQEPSARKIDPQMQSSPNQPAKAATPRHQPLSSLHSPSPPNLARGQHEAMTPRPSGPLRNHLCSLRSPRTRNRFMRAMTRTRIRSRGTATATRSALVTWWHAIMMLVRASGSIYRVSG